MTAREQRVMQLMESWRVLVQEWEQAVRWRDRRRLGGLATALKLVDACIAIEEGALAERDDWGNVVRDLDQDVTARLRAIARMRNIFEGTRSAAAEENPASEALPAAEAAPAQSDEAGA